MGDWRRLAGDRQLQRMMVLALLLLNLLLVVLKALRPPPEVEAASRGGGQKAELAGIVLLEELPGAGADATAGVHCFTLGPFTDAAMRDAAMATVREAVQSVQGWAAEAEVTRGYWVYIPPFNSLEAARAAAAEMRAAGLTDINVASGDEWNLSISAGFFGNRMNALNRMDQLAAAGFQARLRPQLTSEMQYWLDYAQHTGGPSAPYLLGEGHAGIAQRPVTCLEPGGQAAEPVDRSEP